ncbi:hypothetical protein [Elioraea sp.]|uniref:hypothetical protein n=1 Tax=Elioraea sp. TaxID=2185103 RepID=UPI003F6F1C71
MPRLVILALALLVTACAAYSLAPAGAPQTVQGIVVVPGQSFNRSTAFNRALTLPDRVEIWTTDGEELDRLTFFGGIADGAPLGKLPPDRSDREQPLPVFRAGMAEGDIADLFVANIVRLGRAPAVVIDAIRPATFLGLPGFRFDFSYSGGDEIDRRGSALATVRDGRLWMIVFEGTRLLHHDRLMPEVERIFATARLRDA